jgi:hypothetical protein
VSFLNVFVSAEERFVGEEIIGRMKKSPRIIRTAFLGKVNPRNLIKLKELLLKTAYLRDVGTDYWKDEFSTSDLEIYFKTLYFCLISSKKGEFGLDDKRYSSLPASSAPDG